MRSKNDQGTFGQRPIPSPTAAPQVQVPQPMGVDQHRPASFAREDYYESQDE